MIYTTITIDLDGFMGNKDAEETAFDYEIIGDSSKRAQAIKSRNSAFSAITTSNSSQFSTLGNRRELNFRQQHSHPETAIPQSHTHHENQIHHHRKQTRHKNRHITSLTPKTYTSQISHSSVGTPKFSETKSNCNFILE